MKTLRNSLFVISVLSLTGCGDHQSQTVTVYVSADEQIARTVIDAFTEQTGVNVQWVGDTEASKTTGLVTRLRREALRPVADVFWSSENIGTIQLAGDGVFAPYNSASTTSWPEQYRDPDGLWYAFSPRARVIAYNPEISDVHEMPQYWWEYGDAAIADPRFGTTGTHMAVMAEDAERFDSFLQKIGGRPFLGGNASTVQAVIDGRATYAMTDSDDVHAAVARGASLAAFLPRHFDGEGGGTLLIPNTVAVVAGCKHPETAGMFVDFMLSDTVATILAESNSKNIPIQPNVAAQFPELIVEDPLQPDFYSAADRRNTAIEQVMQHVKETSAK